MLSRQRAARWTAAVAVKWAEVWIFGICQGALEATIYCHDDMCPCRGEWEDFKASNAFFLPHPAGWQVPRERDFSVPKAQGYH